MKIGILTFHFAYNYGAMLQAYALERFLNNQRNVRCEIIDYRPRKVDYLYHPNVIDMCKQPTTILRNYIKKKISGTETTEFENFINENFVLSNRIRNENDIKKVVRGYDILIVGSDQVWNPIITGYDRNYFLCDLPTNIKRFSYAASLGQNDIDEVWKKELKLNLTLFEKISVRERQACQIIEKLLPEREILVTPDPVFLLSKQEWRMIEKKVSIKEKYILFYCLSESRDLERSTMELSIREGLKIISIHPLFKPIIGERMCNCAPDSFLGLINNAEYICTDSFHATAFSVIFGKKLIVKYDREKGNRIANLLSKFENAIVEDSETIGRYEFKAECRELTVLKGMGERYIEECLGKDENKKE